MASRTAPPRNFFERHRVATLLSFVVLVLLGLDLGAGAAFNTRAIRAPHPIYHHGLLPMARGHEHFGTRRALYLTNDLGMRDAARRRVPLEATRRRILVLGDSFAEGVGYRYPRTAVGLTAAALPDSELLNAAVVSFSPGLAYLRLVQLLDDVGLEIDEVVLFVDISDVQDEYLYEGFAPDTIDRDAFAAWRRSRRLRDWSFTAARIAQLRQREDAVAWFDEGVFPSLMERYRTAMTPAFLRLRASWPAEPPPLRPWVERGLALQAESLDRIADRCERDGLPLTLVAYPWPDQLGEAGLHGPHIDPLRRFARDRGLGFVDLYRDFAKLGPPDSVRAGYFIPGDVHWNREGNRVVSEALTASLRR